MFVGYPPSTRMVKIPCTKVIENKKKQMRKKLAKIKTENN